MASRARDYQRQRVYDWENGIFSEVAKTQKEMPLGRIRHLSNKIAQYYRIRSPLVKPGQGRRSACWSPNENAIKMPKLARNPQMTCHEMAHCVHWNFFRHMHSKTHSAHGPFFVAIMMFLWNKYYKVDIDILKQSAVDAGVDYGNLDLVDRDSIREHSRRTKRNG